MTSEKTTGVALFRVKRYCKGAPKNHGEDPLLTIAITILQQWQQRNDSRVHTPGSYYYVGAFQCTWRLFHYPLLLI